ncbi:MAG: T9SS type A sorting domain-containing protein [Chitinophagaceae bacterium]|nr:T9SS type A sorting domain-containing protein [Chitinophagaceae bacterium]
MKSIATLLSLLLFFAQTLFSQQYQWIHSNTLSFNLNPSLPVNTVSVSESGQVYFAHPDSSVIIYGNDIFGETSVDCYSDAGDLQWSIQLGNKVVVSEIMADVNENVYVGGSFMETMSINGVDSLVNTGNNFNTNAFLLCFNTNGMLVWKRNISLQHDSYTNIAAITVDQQDQIWYGASDFLSAEVFKLDASGNELLSYELTNAKTLGGMSFDADGNLFLSGATSTPFLTIGNLSVPVSETYMMYVPYINASGVTQWIRLASDVTFQTPQVQADPWGNAYVSGSLFLGTSFGTVSFIDPQWLYDVFITRVDKYGNFKWGVQAPQNTGGITGDFSRGGKNFIAVDGAGNLYLTGITRGTLDWGNNVMSGLGALSFGSLSVLSFDTSGNALWSMNGGSSDFNQAYSLDATTSGKCYFSASIIDEAIFGNIIVNTDEGFASVLGKISAGIPTVVQSINNSFSIDVYPNPMDAVCVVHFDAQKKGEIQLDLFDLEGKLRKSISREITIAGHQALSFSVADITPGIYGLQIKSADGIRRKEIVVN